MGTRSRQCQPKVPGRFAFSGARNPRIYRVSRFGQFFPGIFSGLSLGFSSGTPEQIPETAIAFSSFLQRLTKGQQPKGKIVSALFHTFWHVSTHFHHTFSEFFLQDFFLELRDFTTVLVQRDEKRIKENKKKRPNHFAIRNARLAIRFKHWDTAKLRKGLRFESAIQNH